MIEGNAAAGLGCLFAGATVAAWYPITPSTSLAEAFERYCSRYRIEEDTGRRSYAIVQAEDELAAIGMAIGAGWNGARAFTATSGPGHLADERVPGTGLLRRNPGGAVQHPARRSVDRHADTHPAVRHHLLRLRESR